MRGKLWMELTKLGMKSIPNFRMTVSVGTANKRMTLTTKLTSRDVAGTKKIAKWLGVPWTAQDCLGAENPRSIPFGFVWKWGLTSNLLSFVQGKWWFTSRFEVCFPQIFQTTQPPLKKAQAPLRSWLIVIYPTPNDGFFLGSSPLLSINHPNPWPLSP